MTQLKGRLFRYLIGVPTVLAFAAVSPAADDTPGATTAATATAGQSSSQSPEVQDLKRQLAEQQKQIDELRMILLGQKKQIDTVTNATAAPVVPPATTVSDPVKRGIGEVASTTPVLPPAPIHASLVPQVTSTQVVATSEPNPLQIKIGDATIQPIGFMDLTNTFRSTNAGSSLQTNFGSIPYTNTVPGRLTEDKFSAANSRIGFRVDAMAKDWHILGYYEGDFVGGVASNNTQVSSNQFAVSHSSLLGRSSQGQVRVPGRPVLEHADAEPQADFGAAWRPVLLASSRRKLHERSHLGPRPWSARPLSSQ